MKCKLVLDSLQIARGGKTLYRDFSLSFAAGSITAILAPSGAGKTTLLDTIAGLLKPLGGEIRFEPEGADAAGAQTARNADASPATMDVPCAGNARAAGAGTSPAMRNASYAGNARGAGAEASPATRDASCVGIALGANAEASPAMQDASCAGNARGAGAGTSPATPDASCAGNARGTTAGTAPATPNASCAGSARGAGAEISPAMLGAPCTGIARAAVAETSPVTTDASWTGIARAANADASPAKGVRGVDADGFRVSYLFQTPRLLPWCSLLQNCVLPLKPLKLWRTAKEAEAYALRFLAMTGLKERAGDLPINLSGGEKQRCALARAFAYPAPVLLMDEAFQSQDIALKKQLYALFRDLLANEPRTVIMVTHDAAEALALAERVVVLKAQSPNTAVLSVALDEPSRRLDERRLHDALAGGN